MSKIINDDTVNDPRIEEEDKKKLNTAPSLQASNAEDGVNEKLRVNDDPVAQGLSNDVDTTKTTIEKEIVYATGGTRGGAYEATDQDSSQWDSRVTPTADAKHTREVEHRCSGEKDSLNTINTAMKAIEDKMQAIEIRRAMKNL